MSEETNPSICLRAECWYEGTPKPRNKAASCLGVVVGLVFGAVAVVFIWLGFVIADGLLPFLDLLGVDGEWGLLQYLMLAVSLLAVPIMVGVGFSWGRKDCPICGGNMAALDSDSGRHAQQARDNFRNLRGL